MYEIFDILRLYNPGCKGKNIEAKLSEKEKEIEIMRDYFTRETQAKGNEFSELKSAVDFLTNKANAPIIGNEPSSKVISMVGNAKSDIIKS